MTLDEAIKHAEEVAEQNEGLCERIHPAMQLSDYSKCASEHRQLAEWLRKLKKYEEGIEQIKELINNYKGCDEWDTVDGMQLALECLEVNADDR